MDRETRKKQFADGLRAEATRRFGAARADALAKNIEDISGWMADLATYPLDPELHPTFYASPTP